jgi:hypothetical protein
MSNKRNKHRSLKQVGQSQQATEKTNQDKFAATQALAISEKPTQQTANTTGRISPQISCTVLPEDRQLLNELTLYASNKVGKILNTSAIIRALIRLGNKCKDELEF